MGYNTYMDIKARLEELRKQKNISIYELTIRADLSENTIYHWYNNKAVPSLTGLIAVCNALEITIEEFFNPKVKGALTVRESELVELFSKCNDEEQQAILTLLRMKKT